ncbi:MAG: sigma-70 family RNA polymerase sigma factor [Planctomycetota bacterium]
MPEPQSNEDLFVDFRVRGNAEAFRHVFQRTAPALTLAARRIGVSPRDLDDVLQETYLAALQSAPRFDHQQDLVNWLCGIMFRKAMGQRRREARRQLDPRHLEAREVESPTEPVELMETTETLREALRGVPEPYGAVLRLHYEEQLTTPQIAARLGRAPSTVRTQLSRGLDWLRKALPTGLSMALFGVFGLPALVRAQTAAPDAGPGAPTRPAVGTRRALWGGAVVAAAVVVGMLFGRRAGVNTPADTPAAAAPTERPDAPDPAEPTTPPTPRRAVAGARSGASPREESSSRFAVHLIRPDGTPIPRMLVGLQPLLPAFPHTVRATYEQLVIRNTDADGIAYFPPVEAPTVRVLLGRGSWQTLSVDPARAAATVTVARSTVLRGDVLDPRGQPVAGAQVFFHSGANPSAPCARSGPDGTFTISASDARIVLWALAPGIGVSPRTTLNLSTTEPNRARLELEPAPGTISGHVWDPRGRPAADALVRLAPRRRVDVVRLARTDAQGAFHAEDLPAGDYSVAAIDAQGAIDRQVVTLSAPTAATVALTLSAGAQLSGRVTLPGGTGAPGLVILTNPRPHLFREGRFLTRVAWTDEEGQFKVPTIPPGMTAARVIDPVDGRVIASQALELDAGTAQVWSPQVPPTGKRKGPISDLVPMIKSMVQFCEPTRDASVTSGDGPLPGPLAPDATGNGAPPGRR